MTSLVVRDAFRAALEAAFPGELYETLNAVPAFFPPDPTQPVPGSPWLTIAFPPAATRRVSLGAPACFRESGQVEISACGASGEGDGPTLTKAEAVRDALWSRQLTPDIRVTDIDPPFSITADDGRYFQAIITAAYVYDAHR